MKVSLLTGNNDPHYQLDLALGLISNDVSVDFIGGDRMEKADQLSGRRVLDNHNIHFFNLRGDNDPKALFHEKIIRVWLYYYKLIKYSIFTDSKLFHIQWLNKFTHFDRTILNIFYKLLGKNIIYTAHNVDTEARDGHSSRLNKWTLRVMYRLMDHIIVHTGKMKIQLQNEFGVHEGNISVIPHGINDLTPNTNLSSSEARKKLNLSDKEKVLLFFGNIASYKGLDYLISSTPELLNTYPEIKVIIAGRIKDSSDYWEKIEEFISQHNLGDHIMECISFIPHEQVEWYFKAADLLVLPYRDIFQSGVIFMSYAFGLPVVATDVGSLSEDIIESKTGFICKPNSLEDLTKTIINYFMSDLYRNLESSREDIKRLAKEKYSWDIIGKETFDLYQSILN